MLGQNKKPSLPSHKLLPETENWKRKLKYNLHWTFLLHDLYLTEAKSFTELLNILEKYFSETGLPSS